MNSAQKQHTVQQLTADLQGKHFYLADSQGLNAQEVTKIRRTCFQVGIKYQVVKNTLLYKALQELKHPNLQELQEKILKGPTSIFIIEENPSQPAKILRNFHKETKQKKPTLKAAFVYDDLIIGNQHLKALTQLKSKEELIAQIIQLLQAPTQNLLSALQSSGSRLAGVLKTIQEKNTPK